MSTGARACGKSLLACVAALVATTAGATAQAQLEPLDEGIELGAWLFRPRLELRLRGEYRRSPVDVGGDVYANHSPLLDDVQRSVPPVRQRVAPVDDQWLFSERARLGFEVEYELLRGVLLLQDARVLGMSPGAPTGLDDGDLAVFEPYEAYIEVASEVERDPPFYARLGRQSFAWGDGRLIGRNDWQPRGGALDAARMVLRVDDVDLEAFGALLSLPGAVPPAHGGNDRQATVDRDGNPVNADGSGAQLYGFRAGWRLFPLLQLEAAGLARIARAPLPRQLTPSDTYVIDARVSGEERGFEYAAEGAIQLGRSAAFGANRDLLAFAAAGRVAWLTALPWDLRFEGFGSYASGDDGGGDSTAELSRFDPILPEVHELHGMMDLHAWSNAFDGGAAVGARPFEDFDARVGGAVVGLAEPGDRWVSGQLIPIGASPTNDSHLLGGEVEARLGYAPWEPLRFEAGYGMFVAADAAKTILAEAGRGDRDLLHFGYLSAELIAP
jgi:hypothetical protein